MYSLVRESEYSLVKASESDNNFPGNKLFHTGLL